MASYYVDATLGDDSDPGTELEPWETIDPKVNAQSLSGDDIIYLKRDEVWYEMLDVTWSGTSGHPITFRDYDSGALPIISGASVGSPTTPVRDYCVYLENEKYIDYINIMTQYAVEDGFRTLGETSVGNTDYINFTGCISHHNDTHGFKGAQNVDSENEACRNLTYTNCQAYNNGYQGFQSSDGSGHHTYSYCISHHNGSCGFRFGETQTGLMSHCESYNNDYGLRMEAWDVEATMPKNITVEYCDIYNNTGVGDSAGVIMLASGSWEFDNLIFRYNMIHDNDAGIIQYQPCNGGEVYYNLIYDNDETGIEWQAYESGGDSEIYNNVVAGNGLGIDTGSGITLLIYNNIFYQNTVQQSLGGGTEDYNCWYPNWAGKGANSIGVDPKFVAPGSSNFHLESDSPCRNDGVDVSLTEDYDGVSVPQETYPAMGAFEYLSGVLSDDAESKLLAHIFKNTQYTQPSNIYIALCKSTIEDDDTGSTLPSEISGGAYARKQCNTWDTSGIQGHATNDLTLEFAEATAEWGIITDFAICDHISTGDMICYGKLSEAKSIHTADIFVIKTDDLDVTLN